MKRKQVAGSIVMIALIMLFASESFAACVDDAGAANVTASADAS